MRHRWQLLPAQQPRQYAKIRSSVSRRRRGHRSNTALSSSIVSCSTRIAASNVRSNSSNIAPAHPAPHAHMEVVEGANAAERRHQDTRAWPIGKNGSDDEEPPPM